MRASSWTAPRRRVPALPELDGKLFEAKELMKARYYQEAKRLLEDVMIAEPWNREALLGLDPDRDAAHTLTTRHRAAHDPALLLVEVVHQAAHRICEGIRKAGVGN